MANGMPTMNSAGMGELFARLRFVLIALLIYRVGTHIPVPGIDPEQLSALFDQNQGTILGLANVFSGGALERMSILALGILPYISASIIMQLMTAVTPQLEQLKKEGEAGRRKISQWTRYLTVVLALVQGSGMTVGLANQGLTYVTGFSFYVTAVASLVTGAVFMMWLGEQITERGVGNGISLLIFAGIVAGLPAAIGQSLEQARQGEISILILLGILVLAAVVIYLGGVHRAGAAPYHGELRKAAAGSQDDAGTSVAFAVKSEHGWGDSGHFCQLHFVISCVGCAVVW